MLDDAGLSKMCWAFAVSVAAYLKNRIPTQSVVGKTPYEAWHGFGQQPSLKHLHVFGFLGFCAPSESETKRLEYGATPGIFVVYSLLRKTVLRVRPIGQDDSLLQRCGIQGKEMVHSTKCCR